MIETTSSPMPAAKPEETAARPDAAKLRSRMLNPFLMRGYLLAKVPMAFLAGTRVRAFDADRCTVSVPYRWLNTNPFRSTYFAVLAMAAELSTGALAMVAVRVAPKPVSLLITGMTAEFGKKAVGLTSFTCADGTPLATAVGRAVATGEPVTCIATATGTAADGTVVARFTFTWSFKVRG